MIPITRTTKNAKNSKTCHGTQSVQEPVPAAGVEVGVGNDTGAGDGEGVGDGEGLGVAAGDVSTGAGGGDGEGGGVLDDGTSVDVSVVVPEAGSADGAVVVGLGVADACRVGSTTGVLVGAETGGASGVAVGATGVCGRDGVGVGGRTTGDGVGVAEPGVPGAVGTVWRCGF